MKQKKLIYALLFILLLLGLDQFTKFLADTYLKQADAIAIIPDIFELVYLENTGAAFGSFLGKTTLLSIATFIIVLYLIIKLKEVPATKHYIPIYLCLCLLISGGLGNLLDRVFRGYVIDFFYFVPIDFPVFNVADIFVCVGVGALILVSFLYKEHELSFLWELRKKK